MATCSYCKSTILFSGRVVENRRFCGKKCELCFAEMRALAQTPCPGFEGGEPISIKTGSTILLSKELNLSSRGIRWGKRHCDLDSITGIGWMARSVTYNLIYRTTDFQVTIANRQGSFIMPIRDELAYCRVVKFLWRAVAGRLLLEASQALKAGQTLRLGSIDIVDDGVRVKQRASLLGPSQPVHIPVPDLKMDLCNGFYRLGSSSNGKISSMVHYEAWNAHVLFHLMGLARGLRVGRFSQALTLIPAYVNRMA